MVVLALMFQVELFAGDSDKKKAEDFTFSGQWFTAYTMDDNSHPSNQFVLRRGYFTAKKKLNQHFSFRITQDIAVDGEGDGVGDLEIRLKYGYLKYSGPDLGKITDLFVEMGVVHRPWLDFEQKINRYRVQGTMYLERIGILRSADFGITVGGNLGGKVDTDYQKKVQKSYPGKYGSFAAGIYNGGGYEAREENDNKYLEGRLTLRPMPEMMTGLQFSLIAGHGKGNIAIEPDFSFGAGIVTFEAQHLALSGTFFAGKGDLRGNSADSLGNVPDRSGFSFFAEVALSPKNLKLFGRYDSFTDQLSAGDLTRERNIAGLSLYFVNNSKVLVDVDHVPGKDGRQDDTVYEIALEVNF